MQNISNQKISKGYRLRPKTHRLIKNIQRLVKGDLDNAISSACRIYLKELKTIKENQK